MGDIPRGETADTARYFRIRDFVIDTERSVILRDGVVHKVEPRAVEVLVYLASAGGRAVSRQELMAQVWKTNVVDEAIQRAISLLRQAFRDDGHSEIIETIPRQGYRLRPEARPVPCPPSLPRGRRPAMPTVLLAFFAGVALGAGIVQYLSSGPTVAPVAPTGDNGGTSIAPPAPQ